ncbi:MAG: DUF3576 domain-containing protein, partial [Pseudomonadota bacterium]
IAVLATFAVSACDGNYAAKEDPRGPTGPVRNPNQVGADGVFGPEGATAGRILDGTILGKSSEDGSSLPVNRYMWQAALDTLDFMPLASTDPFTGVIATDWSTPPSAPGERVKVTVYIVTPDLAASALKVAVFREARTETGQWLPAAVNPNTPRQLEDAILTRARQIKIADVEGRTTG